MDRRNNITKTEVPGNFQLSTMTMYHRSKNILLADFLTLSYEGSYLIG